MSQSKKWILLATAVTALAVALLVGLLLYWNLVPRLSSSEVGPAVVLATAGALVAAAATMWTILEIIGASFRDVASPRVAHPRAGSAAPATLSEFVGREDEIHRLVDRLRPGRRVAITAVTGMGGVGKTELARVAAARVADRFRDGVLWAECGKQDLPAIASLWAGVWGQQLAGGDEEARASAWRALVGGREALLVFDDVQPGQPVETLFPPQGRSAVLVTTRDTQHPALREAERLALEQFSEREAMDLARVVLGERRAEEEAAFGETGRFFRLVGYLPLGVSVGLHQARESGWDLATLNGRLEAAGALAVLDDEDRLRRSLNASFEAAWQSLGPLQPAFAALALFGEGTSFDTAAAAAVLGVDEAQAGAHLERLVELSLLSRAGGGPGPAQDDGRTAGPGEALAASTGEEPTLSAGEGLAASSDDAPVLSTGEGQVLSQREASVPGAGEERWTLHTLLRAFAAGKGPLGVGAPARLAGHYMTVCARADRLYKQGGEGVRRGLGLFDLEWPHIRAGQAWAAAHWQENDEAARLCSAYPDASVYCLSLRLGPPERIEWLAVAAQAAQRLGNRAAEGRHMGNLGLAYADLGEKRRAIEYYEQALAISREICEASTAGSPQWTAGRRAEGNSLGSLGNAHAALGRARQAIEHYEQALAIAREIGDRRGEGNRLGNLGNAYLALGEARRAIECYAQALVIARDIGDRRAEGLNVGNLGNAYRNLGEARQALGYYQEALDISRELGDRRNEGIHLGNLGNAYAALGEARQAIEYYDQALAIAREIGDRIGEGNRLGNLGLAYLQLGEAGRAIEYHEEALAVVQQIGDRRAEGSHLANLGNAYVDLGEARQAVECYEEALAISREIGDRQAAENRLSTLANALWAVGEPQRAIEYLEEALVVSREICAASTQGSPEWRAGRRAEGNRLASLGNAYLDLREARRAIQCYDQALAISRQLRAASTEGSPEWTADRRAEGSHLNRLGNASYVLGKAPRATELFEQALAISRQLCAASTEGSPEWTADRRGQRANLDGLGNVYIDLGQAPRALECFQEALTISRETGDRRGEAADLNNVGTTYVALAEARQAIEHYEGAMAIAREVRDRQGEAKQLGNLANAYAALGESQRAIEYHLQALAIAREIGNASAEKMTLGSLGLAYATQGEAEQAIKYFDQALTISRETGDRHNEEITLGNLGLAYAALGRVRRAIEYFEAALASSREIGDRRGEASHLANLGLAYTDLGRAEKAIECYEKGLVIARDIGDRLSEGADLGNLGNAYRALGKAGRAIEHYQGALAISREICAASTEGSPEWTAGRRAEGAHLGSLGNAYSALREVQPAIEHYERALAISREICAASTEGSPEWTAGRRSEQVHLANLGLAYRHLGEPRRAIDYYVEVLAIDRENGDRRAEASHLANLGLAYADLRRARRAIECHERALAIAREICAASTEGSPEWTAGRRAEGKYLGNLGLAHAGLGEARRAIQYFEEALAIAREIGDRRAEGNHSWNLGLLFAESDPSQAAELMGVLVAYEKEIGHPSAEADARRVAEVLERAGRRRRALLTARSGEQKALG